MKIKFILGLIIILSTINMVSAGWIWDDVNVYYDFNQTSGDIIPNIFNASKNNATIGNFTNSAWVSGILNNAYTFNGVNQSAVISNTPDIEFHGTDYSVSLWVNMTDYITGDFSFLINDRTGVTNGWAISVGGSTSGSLFGKVDVRHWGSSDKVTSSSNITLGNWTHIALTYDADTNVSSLYINGVLENSSIIPHAVYADGVMRIGIEDFTVNRWINGTIDELGLWRKKLSSGEVASLYNEGSPPEFDTPVGFIDKIFNSSTFEMKNETFSLNLTFDNETFDTLTANLIYDGTSFASTGTSSGNLILFTKNLEIPILPSNSPLNRSFHWQVILVNSTDTVIVNSTTNNQTVEPVLFHECNASLSIPVVVNFSIFDESNLTSINASFDSTFNFGLIETGQKKNITFSSAFDNSSYQFCTNLNETYFVSSTINLQADGSAERTFEFNNEPYSNITTEQSLHLLNSSEGTNIIVQVVDPGLQPLENYGVDVQRFFPQTNKFLSVVKDETDEFGQFVANLIESTVKYRFIISNPSGRVVKTTGKVTIACRNVICVIQLVVEDTTDDFERLENITDFQSSLVFNNVTNIFTYTWNDVTGDSITSRLLVERISFNGTTVVCDKNSTALSGSLSCNVGSGAFSYSAQGYRRVSGENEHRQELLSIKVGDPSGVYGREGLIWAFLLLFTLIGVGSYNPPVGIVLYFFGFTVLGIMGVITFSPSIFFANLVLCGLFIWAFRS